MLIRRWKKFSIKKKGVLLLLFAVLLPAILIFLGQYKAFSELRVKSKSAYENGLREKFFEIEAKTETKLFESGNTILKDFPPVAVHDWDRDKIAVQLEEILQKNENVEEAYAFDKNGSQIHIAVSNRNQGYREARSSGNPSNIFESFGNTEDVVLPLIGSLQSSKRIQKASEYFTAQQRCERCPIGTESPTEFIYLYRVFTTLPASASLQSLSFVGVRLNNEVVIKDFLSPGIEESIRAGVEKNQDEMIFGIFNQQNHLLFTNGDQSDQNSFEIRSEFRSVFPLWTIAGSLRDSKISDLTDRIFQLQMFSMLLVFALLIFGVTLLLRVARREVGLAEAKSAFVSNVSHELKTPLSLIRLFAETLQSGRVKSPEKKQEYYRIIGNETRRLTLLIDNILDFSAIEAGRKKYDFAHCDLSEVVSEVVQNYTYSLENAGFNVVSNFAEDLPLVSIDCDAISQAVLNLLNNAAKYSTDEKYVEINVERRHANIVIEVTDHGIGIAPLEQEKIFEDFYRIGGSADVHNVKGSGLGLALVKHIVQAHQGLISVKSIINRGSTFTITLPIYVPGENGNNNE